MNDMIESRSDHEIAGDLMRSAESGQDFLCFTSQPPGVFYTTNNNIYAPFFTLNEWLSIMRSAPRGDQINGYIAWLGCFRAIQDEVSENNYFFNVIRGHEDMFYREDPMVSWMAMVESCEVEDYVVEESSPGVTDISAIDVFSVNANIYVNSDIGVLYAVVVGQSGDGSVIFQRNIYPANSDAAECLEDMIRGSASAFGLVPDIDIVVDRIDCIGGGGVSAKPKRTDPDDVFAYSEISGYSH